MRQHAEHRGHGVQAFQRGLLEKHQVAHEVAVARQERGCLSGEKDVVREGGQHPLEQQQGGHHEEPQRLGTVWLEHSRRLPKPQSRHKAAAAADAVG